jgi:hypothetical protein
MQCQALGCLGRLAGGLVEPFAVSLAQHQQVRFRWFKDKVENRSDFPTENLDYFGLVIRIQGN